MPRLKTALRPVDIPGAWTPQEVLKTMIQVEYLQTADMPADGLTKPSNRVKICKVRTAART
jgi:hypothetical protein